MKDRRLPQKDCYPRGLIDSGEKAHRTSRGDVGAHLVSDWLLGHCILELFWSFRNAASASIPQLRPPNIWSKGKIMLRPLPVLLACLSIVAGLQAQQANQQQLDQALELLRRSKAATTNVATNTVAVANTNRLAITNAGEGTLAPDMESRARDMLRRALSGAKTPGTTTAPTSPASAVPPTVASPTPAPAQTLPKTQPPTTAAVPPPATVPAPRTSPAAAPSPQPPPAAAAPRPAETQISGISKVPSTSPSLTPEMERKARELLDQAHRDLVTEGVPPRQPAPPAAVPAPRLDPPAVRWDAPAVAPPVTAPPPPQQRAGPTLAIAPPAATPPPKSPPSAVATSSLTPEMEAKARQLLDQAIAARQPAQPITPPPGQAVVPPPARPISPPPAEVPRSTFPATPVARPSAPGPTPAVAPPVAVQPPPAQRTPPPVQATAPAQSSVPSQPVQPSRPTPSAGVGPMTAEQEAQARSLIDEATQKLQPEATASAPDTRARRDGERPNAEMTNKAAREKTIKDLEKEARDAAKSRPESRPTARKSTPPPTRTESTASTAPATSAAPAISSSARTKQDRLAQLLDAYRRDQIGPTEYHQQRAKILAEP